MLTLDTHWIWDSWPIDDGPYHHLYYLKAPRSLGDPDLRHLNPTVGHAVSTDYRTWRELPDALTPGPPGAWDDLTVWTGSVVRGADQWHMFYTGGNRREGARVQRIGRADSDDLVTWRRHGTQPVSTADPRWYERLGDSEWPEESWRDPWVYADPAGDGWHMLITARARTGPTGARGVIGHARSTDLTHWDVGPPLTTPAGFAHLEVPQVVDVGHRAVLFFSCSERDLDGARAAHSPPRTATWIAPAGGLLGPFDVDSATPFPDATLYAARLVRTSPGHWALLGFRSEHDGEFGGFIDDPVPVQIDSSGTFLPPCAAA